MNIFFNVGNAVGMLTGGVLGDLFAKRSPRYARPFVNQLSMIIIAPLFFILYKALPGERQHPACGCQACCMQTEQYAMRSLCSKHTTKAQLSACRGIIYSGPTALHPCLYPLLTCTGIPIAWRPQCQLQHVCLWAAGSSRFTDGVPGHLHGSLPSYCALLFFMTIVAPWKQANNAAMFAEVWFARVSPGIPSQKYPRSPCCTPSSHDCLAHLLQKASAQASWQVSCLEEDALCVQVVPDNLRSSAYAFDKGITGLLGALAAPLVRPSAPSVLLLMMPGIWQGRTCSLCDTFL